MALEFDPDKDAANLAKHGVSLERAHDLEVEARVADGRFDEPRFRAYGRIDGAAVRAISLRRAHQREYGRHVRNAE